METPARHSFTLDGTTRVFPIPSNLKGDNYVRLEVDDVIISDRTKYDIVNNSIVFNSITDVPAGSQLDVLVVQSEEALGSLSITSNIDLVASNIVTVNIVGANIVDVTTVADNIAEVLAADTNAATATTQAGIATTQATTATTQATTATTQAGIAATQAGIATTQAGVATTKATEASTSASNALTSAGNASTSATNANASAGSASTSASNASASATTAATSASNASTSASNASTSASTSTTQATNSATSATLSEAWASKTTGTVDGANFSAKYYATNANVGTVAANIANVNTVAGNDANVTTVASSIADVNLVGGSITNVNEVASNLGSVNAFGEQYRVSATAPTTSLDDGDLWFDTTTSTMKVYSGSSFVNAGSAVNGIDNSVEYTATAGQTTFAVTYDIGYVVVYLNGLRLDAADYTATDGANVVLDTGATVGDSVYIQAFGAFELADSYTKVASDARFLTPTGDGSSLTGIASFDSGTRMAFQQTSAPTGWTKDTTAAIDDSVLRLVTGGVSSGGSTAFSTFNGQTTVGATTLSVAQMPSHNHTAGASFSSGGASKGQAVRTTDSTGFATSATGGGGSHSHSLTTAIKYYDFIIATKD